MEAKVMALPLEVAQELLLQAARTVATEEAELAECWQRVLAAPVVADSDFPPFDRSPLDGYALKAAEVEKADPERPVVLTIVDDIPAGSVPRVEVRPGTAAKIMTGAPLPPGASGVVRREDAREEDGGWRFIPAPASPPIFAGRARESPPARRSSLPGRWSMPA
jgi:molybdopterin molybdotransferase